MHRLSPKEQLIGCGADIIGVEDFWVWAYSDILSNRNRCAFAEFLIGRALGITDGSRKEWNYVDHKYKDETIEVKSTGFVQSWNPRETKSQTGKQKSPVFDKKKTRAWHEDRNEHGTEVERSADC